MPDGAAAGRARRAVRAALHGGVGNQNVDTWDAHGESSEPHAARRRGRSPTVGLLTDLKARGLLDSTLVDLHRSSAACRFHSAASAAITIPARKC